MAELTPYSYRTKPGPLHSVGAGPKLAALCALSLAAFLGGLPGLVATTLSVAIAAAVSRLTPAFLFSGSRPLALATGLVVALRAFRFGSSAPPFFAVDTAGLAESLVFAWGVFAAFAAGSVLFATTTTAELRAALSRAEVSVKRFLLPCLPRRWRTILGRADLSLALALAIAFIPRVFAVWEAAEDAHAARCGRKGVRALASLLPLAADRLIEAASETAAAMTSRGYEGARHLD